MPGGTARRRSKVAHPAEAPATADLSSLASELQSAPLTTPEPDPHQGIPFDSDTEEIIAGCASRLTLTDVRRLAHAVDQGQAVTVEYLAASGNRTVRTLSGLELDPQPLAEPAVPGRAAGRGRRAPQRGRRTGCEW
ncbi:hypothetical protein ACWD01_04205 [Streptomyces sp. NPDC002835]